MIVQALKPWLEEHEHGGRRMLSGSEHRLGQPQQSSASSVRDGPLFCKKTLTNPPSPSPICHRESPGDIDWF
jgi:hypothetical protein